MPSPSPSPAPMTPATPSRSVWRWLAPVIFAVAGLLFTTSFQTARGTDLRSDRGLPGLIDAGTRAVADKAARVTTLQTQIDDLTAAAAARGDTTVSKLTASADEIAPSAGLTEVDGPAVVVTLDDAKQGSAQLPDGVTPDDLVVHQQDVQAVVNALWRGGAEAMMIQDQRVIATSAVRCVGNTLILQGRVTRHPSSSRRWARSMRSRRPSTPTPRSRSIGNMSMRSVLVMTSRSSPRPDSRRSPERLG